MTPASLKRLAVATAASAGVIALAIGPAGASASGSAKMDDELVPVRILSINDLHGNLEPPTGSSGRIADETGTVVDGVGGAAYLATYVKQQRNRDTVLVAAGDLIGASPLLSAAFHDEPTVAFLDSLELATSSAGNHEFDEGYAELKRVMEGKCHPVDGCSPAGKWKGTDFEFIAANVIDTEKNKPALAPYYVERINGEKVAFIGLVTKTTPTIVTASGIAGLEFTDEVAAANETSAYLRDVKGIKAQVVLVHEGDQVTPNQSPDACPITKGAGSRIAEGIDPEIDIVISGHSHQAYICKATDPAGQQRVYTQGSSFGRVLTQIDFQIDKGTGDIVRSSVVADNTVVRRTVTPDPATVTFINDWKARVATVANKKVGDITADITNVAGPSGESPLGNLIADSQLESAKAGGNAEIALMNPGGIRTTLTYASSPAGEGPGVTTYGEIFAVQPFNNLVQVVTLTGAQLKLVLEQQWVGGPNNQAFTKILQPSSNLTYSYSNSAAWGSKVSDIKIDGVPVTPTQSIRVAANNFLVGGGDAFAAFTQGTDLWSGPLDIDAFEDYLTANSPVAPPVANHITVLP
ncbi:bifunctional metallophosphatase/5'-nucleotidase [Herbidospora sp. NEAU-GS84]|uniref:Bifunctional metallophosphatase/5'-nucleotidase n=1 Tax=Herbidospora solisilvae TaxID=2696284 RepID=A0A7C9JEP3_9ACTN|nr:bifunctional metallophosphatase/5'-nucleotidase [Herbidospora solisilvae]NAS25384.1 bifunctional metallophosphatase/5'-nucleotidase [Herbidospora solisilvae]